MANKLSEGVVGKQLINYFMEQSSLTELGFGPDRHTPVNAECLTYFIDANQAQYRITFADDSVSDWLITFESDDSNVIVSAEQFNEVL